MGSGAGVVEDWEDAVGEGGGFGRGSGGVGGGGKVFGGFGVVEGGMDGVLPQSELNFK